MEIILSYVSDGSRVTGYRGGSGSGITKHTDDVYQPITNDGAYYTATVPTHGSQPAWETAVAPASSASSASYTSGSSSGNTRRTGGSSSGGSGSATGGSSGSSSDASSSPSSAGGSTASSGGNSDVGYRSSDAGMIQQIGENVSSMMSSGVPSQQIVQYVMSQDISDAMKVDWIALIESNSGEGSINYF